MSNETRTVPLLCVLGVAPFVLCSCGGAMVQFGEHEIAITVGEHEIRIIESHPEGGGSTRLYDLPDGTRAYKYESITLKVTLENEVLTVNDKKYLMSRKDDCIKITDGRVEINGQPVD